MFRFPEVLAQEDATLADQIASEVTKEVAEDPAGFVTEGVSIWQQLTQEVVPAFKALWYALRSFGLALQNFLADWIGEPLRRVIDGSESAQDLLNTGSSIIDLLP